MRKGRDGGKKTGKKRGGGEEKTDDYSGQYVIASRRLPERRPLERRTLVPELDFNPTVQNSLLVFHFGLKKKVVEFPLSV